MSEVLTKLAVDALPLRQALREEWASAISGIYDAEGIVVLRGLLDQSAVKSIQRELRVVIRLALDNLRAQSKVTTPDAGLRNNSRFDAGMLDVCAANRAVGGEIFRVAKKLMAVQRLSAAPIFETVAGALMRSESVTIYPAGTNVRADHPGEDHYLYPWHQDYLYNLGSQDSVTFWMPLVDVDDINGCLIVAPRSHEKGIQPVVAQDPLNKHSNSAQSFLIADVNAALEGTPPITVPMSVGDVVVFHGNLLHASQANKSDATRWSLQFRYFNLKASDAVARGWPGGMAEGVDFTRYHPEAVVTLPGVGS
jgi:ectoine hydroxylase-related dioxygenase (phytanoyl-CoA dioxygenase family)